MRSHDLASTDIADAVRVERVFGGEVLERLA